MSTEAISDVTQEGLMSPGTRAALRKPGRTHSAHSDSSDDSPRESGDGGMSSLLPQLARQSSLILHGGLGVSPIVNNADYSEQLTNLRKHVMTHGSTAVSSTLCSTPEKESLSTSSVVTDSHLPAGVRGFEIHEDVWIAPHKLQQAIYEARREVQLFNDRLLRKEATSPFNLEPSSDSLDARAISRMSKYTNMWTRGGNIPLFYKDAERKALDLVTKLHGNASGTVPPAKVKEMPKILEELGSMRSVKGHPALMDMVLSCCKSKEWSVRLKAVQIIPALFYKGDPSAIGIVTGRLLDWHLEVRRAAVEVLQDSSATLTLKAVSGKDLAQPYVVSALERLENELLGILPPVAAATTSGTGGFSRAPSSGFQRVPSHSSASGSRPPTSGAPGSRGSTAMVAAVGAFSRLRSDASRRSSGTRAGSAVSRTSSTASKRRPIEKPVITVHLAYRFENSDADASAGARTTSQPFSRRPKWKGGGETLRMQVQDPEQATLVVELIVQINGGGPPDEKCTFHGLKTHEGESYPTADDARSSHSRPSTQETAGVGRVMSRAPSAADQFSRAPSAASAASNPPLHQPFKIDGPLPPSTIVLGRAEFNLTNIANQIVKSEQWVQFSDGHGKSVGSVSMSFHLEGATGIGSSETMGREMGVLIAPALLDADAFIRARALRLYQMCISAGWEKERKRELAREQHRSAALRLEREVCLYYLSLVSARDLVELMIKCLCAASREGSCSEVSDAAQFGSHRQIGF
jgi:hypothetical protein